VSDCCLIPTQQFFSYIMRVQVNCQWDDYEARLLLNQHAQLDIVYSASSLRQQSADRHVALLGHTIVIPSQPTFVLSPPCCVLSGEATHIYFEVFGLTRSGLEPTIYHTRGEHANHIPPMPFFLHFLWCIGFSLVLIAADHFFFFLKDELNNISYY
jgi:hypothetical protein